MLIIRLVLHKGESVFLLSWVALFCVYITLHYLRSFKEGGGLLTVSTLLDLKCPLFTWEKTYTLCGTYAKFLSKLVHIIVTTWKGVNFLMFLFWCTSYKGHYYCLRWLRIDWAVFKRFPGLLHSCLLLNKVYCRILMHSVFFCCLWNYLTEDCKTCYT